MKIKAIILSLCILGLFGLSGCNRPADSENNSIALQGSASISKDNETKNNEIEKEITISPEVKEAAEQALEIANQYKELYVDAEKHKEEYFPYDMVLSQESIDEIENQFITDGYPIIDSDEIYPDYLANSESLYDFWEAVIRNKEAEQWLISVSSTGGLHFRQLTSCNGVRQYTAVYVEWNEKNEPYIDDMEQRDILDWDLTEAGHFYFQILPTDHHYDDYSMIRLEPVKKKLYDLNTQYVIPIGYQSNNLFTSNWDSSDFGELCLNDLFEFLYRVKYHDYYNENGGSIPADVFEHVIKPYFDISWDEFRERCLYDEANQCYPWQEIGADNVTYYPALEPDVIEKHDNNDGTFTLVVDVRCNDNKEDRLFTHEVTIRPLEDGSYQYVSNQITYKGEYELPEYYPRVSQRGE